MPRRSVLAWQTSWRSTSKQNCLTHRQPCLAAMHGGHLREAASAKVTTERVAPRELSLATKEPRGRSRKQITQAGRVYVSSHSVLLVRIVLLPLASQTRWSLCVSYFVSVRLRTALIAWRPAVGREERRDDDDERRPANGNEERRGEPRRRDETSNARKRASERGERATMTTQHERRQTRARECTQHQPRDRKGRAAKSTTVIRGEWGAVRVGVSRVGGWVTSWFAQSVRGTEVCGFPGQARPVA